MDIITVFKGQEEEDDHTIYNTLKVYDKIRNSSNILPLK